jgi:Tol biopolymer transport system component
MWTPDGTHLTTVRARMTATDVLVSPANGTAGQEPLYGTGDILYAVSWTSDGQSLVLMRLGVRGASGLWKLDVAQKTIRPVMPPAAELGGRLSPDNKWIAFFSVVDGRWQLFVTSFPVPGARMQVSRDGAGEAVWSRSGKELFFRNGNQMLSAAVRAGTPFSMDAPRVLFEGNYVGGGGPGDVQYDVSKDDSRFLMMEEQAPNVLRFNVIQGWERFVK